MPKRLKIIYIITSLDYGGAERLVLDLIRSLDKKKFETKVVAIMRGGPLEEELRKLGVEVKIIGKKTKLGLGAILEIRKYLKKEKPDLAHTHLFAGDVWGGIAAILAGALFISTEHNLNLDEGLLKRVTKCLVLSAARKVIAVSLAVQKYAEKTYCLKKEKIIIIYNGIDLEKYKKRGASPSRGKIIIGAVGRLEEQKGQKYLIEAMPEAIKRFPNVELQIVGDGRLRGELEKETASLKISDKVKFIGRTSKVAEFLAGLDIFVLPSLWEGFGIALLEAQAVGVPIVASNVGGCPEIITDKKNGLLVPTANSRALAEAIIWLLDNPAKAQEFVARGQEKVKQFDIRNIVKQYEEIYEQVISNSTKLRK